jgi:hypothetical protein
MWVVKDSLVEFPAAPKLKPLIDPKANPLVIKACPLRGKARLKPVVG